MKRKYAVRNMPKMTMPAGVVMTTRRFEAIVDEFVAAPFWAVDAYDHGPCYDSVVGTVAGRRDAAAEWLRDRFAAIQSDRRVAEVDTKPAERADPWGPDDVEEGDF